MASVSAQAVRDHAHRLRVNNVARFAIERDLISAAVVTKPAHHL